jgi:hypothetical protein
MRKKLWCGMVRTSFEDGRRIEAAARAGRQSVSAFCATAVLERLERDAAEARLWSNDSARRVMFGVLQHPAVRKAIGAEWARPGGGATVKRAFEKLEALQRRKGRGARG